MAHRSGRWGKRRPARWRTQWWPLHAMMAVIRPPTTASVLLRHELGFAVPEGSLESCSLAPSATLTSREQEEAAWEAAAELLVVCRGRRMAPVALPSSGWRPWEFASSYRTRRRSRASLARLAPPRRGGAPRGGTGGTRWRGRTPCGLRWMSLCCSLCSTPRSTVR